MASGLRLQRYDLGHLSEGSAVLVTLSTGANVRLMTKSDFENFRRGRAHRYQGGLARRSPLRLPVPYDGDWVVTIDLAGLAATTVTSRVRVERAD